MAKIKITQTGSPIRRTKDQRATLVPVLPELRLECLAADQVEPEAVVEALVVAHHDVVEHRERQAHARALERAGDAGAIDRLRAGARQVHAAGGTQRA